MTKDGVIIEYFEWLCDIVCGDRYSKQVSYSNLLTQLFKTEFTYLLPMDSNRAQNGIDLRYRFCRIKGYYGDLVNYLDGPCNILEMMVALAIRCEETIMDDPQKGDRTGQWFWGMIVNLGLGSMDNNRFNAEHVSNRIDIFLNREYEPNGRGGLFTIRNCKYDLRDVEIWYQLCWYLDTII